MSNSEKKQYMQDLVRGLELAEYRMLREKAMHNETIIQGDGNWCHGTFLAPSHCLPRPTQ